MAKIFNLPIMDLSPLVIVRTIILNAIPGIIFGWLYYKKGIEMAMVSHFSADQVLHVFTSLITCLL